MLLQVLTGVEKLFLKIFQFTAYMWANGFQFDDKLSLNKPCSLNLCLQIMHIIALSIWLLWAWRKRCLSRLNWSFKTFSNGNIKYCEISHTTYFDHRILSKVLLQISISILSTHFYSFNWLILSFVRYESQNPIYPFNNFPVPEASMLASMIFTFKFFYF